MTVEERKAKLQEIKEKVESWQSSLSEMLEFMEVEYKKINEEFSEAKEEPTPEELEIAKEIRRFKKQKYNASLNTRHHFWDNSRYINWCSNLFLLAPAKNKKI